MNLVGLLVSIALSSAFAEQEVPETIFLPYSETEDVDFTIDRPSRVGCYQWSCENEEVIELIPINTDHKLQCGSRLEIKILPKTADPNGPVKLTILAENVDMEAYENAAIQSIEYTVVVVPVGKLEVMGLKTELQAGDEPVPYGVAAYDKEGNEFDTLDGVQLGWFVGAKKDVARFQGSQTGPIVQLEPLSAGKGAVICLINDPNYEGLEPALLDFTVSAPLQMEPDGIYLLAGGEAKLALFEKIGKKDNPVLSPIAIKGELAEFTIASREDDIVRVDIEREVLIAGIPDDETSILVKDLEGNILKGVPIRTASPHRMEIKSHPYPESKQLIVNQEYDINITIFDKEDHKIYPSENILTKTTFGKQFDIIEISMNGLWAKVRPTMVGIGKIKASLRSTLTPDDDETEITPHIKGVTDFEIYESVLVNPRQTVLPWDAATKPDYQLSYKVTGGGKVYGYKVEPDNMATIDNEGKVKIMNGPGLLTVTAGMTQSMHNNHTSKIVLISPTELELPESNSEWMVGHQISIPVAVYGLHPETKEKVMFSDCSDLKIDVALSNSKDFTIEEPGRRGEHHARDSCTTIHIKGNTAGATTKATVSYTIPATKKELKMFRHIATYEQLEPVHPSTAGNSQSAPQLVLPVGSSRKVLFKGGPHPWVGKPSFFFTDAEAEDEEIVRATLISKTPFPYTAADITCLKLGETKVEITVGNKPSTTNKKPGFQRRSVLVFCSEPAKISKIDIQTSNQGSQFKKPIGNPKTGRIMVYSYRDFKLVTTVKDKEGRTFDNTSSLQFRYTFSDDSMAKVGKPQIVTSYPTQEVSSIELPFKNTQVIYPNGIKGDLDVQVAISGYKADVLKSVGVEVAPDIPQPPEAFGDMEDYDYDDDGELIVSDNHGVAEEISLTLAVDAELEMIYDEKRPFQNSN
eukprot:TRINITY_DN45475_c0_g1_i1.p1 TRINITY_DN45475_c0_g1~~TRINITY_DN45475_c0_g1_i1.p1  ORF type:complete len:919 (-),score=251.02 TRINITY_DN45475_c0_g1_i1:238-2994(-)